MEWDETCGVVWEILATSKAPMTAQNISDVGVEPSDVRSALAKLQGSGLVERQGMEGSRPQYVAVRRLTPLLWAKAVEIGVGVDQLGRLAQLSSMNQDAVLKIASDGTLERVAQEERATKLRHREEVRAGEAATRIAATDLAKLLEDTDDALAVLTQKGHDVSPQEMATRVALQHARQEASAALECLLAAFHKEAL